MLLLQLGYFCIALILFLLASYPFFDEMRNGDSFIANLRKLRKDRRKGSGFLALAFLNLNLSFLTLIFIK